MALQARLALAATILCVPSLSSARQAPESVRWVTTFERARGVGPGAYVILGDQPEIVTLFVVVVLNGAALLNVDDAADAIDVSVQRNGRPLSVTTGVTFPERPLAGVLEVDEGVEMRLSLRRENRAAFTEGHYSVNIDVRRFYSALERADGSPVTTNRSRETKHIEIKLPASASEWADYHGTEGMAALSAGDNDLAVRHLKRATDYRPEDWSVQASLGLAYMRQRRYADAIGPLQKAFPSSLNAPDERGRSSVAGRLATALVALHRDDEAVSVLRTAGVPPEAIPERIEKLRAALVPP